MLSSRIKWARCAKNKVYRSIFAARECRRPAHTPGELLALVTDAIALAIQFHHEASHVRRLAMKKELHKDYGSVCSTVVGTAEFLFGDFSKLTKDITDANKLKKKMRPPPSSQPDAATCTMLTLTSRMDPSLDREKTGLIPTSTMRVGNLPWLQKFEFFSAQPVSIFKKKKKGARSHNAIDT